jgi:hypothetical protein
MADFIQIQASPFILLLAHSKVVSLSIYSGFTQSTVINIVIVLRIGNHRTGEILPKFRILQVLLFVFRLELGLNYCVCHVLPRNVSRKMRRGHIWRKKNFQRNRNYLEENLDSQGKNRDNTPEVCVLMCIFNRNTAFVTCFNRNTAIVSYFNRNTAIVTC